VFTSSTINFDSRTLFYRHCGEVHCSRSGHEEIDLISLTKSTGYQLQQEKLAGSYAFHFFIWPLPLLQPVHTLFWSKRQANNLCPDLPNTAGEDLLLPKPGDGEPSFSGMYSHQNDLDGCQSLDFIATIDGSTMKSWYANAGLVPSAVRWCKLGQSKGNEIAGHTDLLDNMAGKKRSDFQQGREDPSEAYH
jgi:hypothetical protein